MTKQYPLHAIPMPTDKNISSLLSCRKMKKIQNLLRYWTSVKFHERNLRQLFRFPNIIVPQVHELILIIEENRYRHIEGKEKQRIVDRRKHQKETKSGQDCSSNKDSDYLKKLFPRRKLKKKKTEETLTNEEQIIYYNMYCHNMHISDLHKQT